VALLEKATLYGVQSKFELNSGVCYFGSSTIRTIVHDYIWITHTKAFPNGQHYTFWESCVTKDCQEMPTLSFNAVLNTFKVAVCVVVVWGRRAGGFMSSEC